MPKPVTMYSVLIASPSDVGPEREAVASAIHRWNEQHAQAMARVYLPIRWETHSRPALGDRPQGHLNRQIVDPSDMLVGLFWWRLGTPTGVADSGSAEEIERFCSEGKAEDVLLYFSDQSLPQDHDPDQFQGLREFKKRMQGLGLVETYASVAELVSKVEQHLLMRARREPEVGTSSEEVALSSQGEAELSELRRMFREWQLARGAGNAGRHDALDVIGGFTEWYLDHFESLGHDAWARLAELAKKVERYPFAMINFQGFYEAGEAVLDWAVQLMEQGALTPPVTGEARSGRQCVVSDSTESMQVEVPHVVSKLGIEAGRVRQILGELQEKGLVREDQYVRAANDYINTEAGAVCAELFPLEVGNSSSLVPDVHNDTGDNDPGDGLEDESAQVFEAIVRSIGKGRTCTEETLGRDLHLSEIRVAHCINQLTERNLVENVVTYDNGNWIKLTESGMSLAVRKGLA